MYNIWKNKCILNFVKKKDNYLELLMICKFRIIYLAGNLKSQIKIILLNYSYLHKC